MPRPSARELAEDGVEPGTVLIATYVEAPTDESHGQPHPGWRGYAKSLGPGLVTGASDDDPSGIATYAQSGAQFQYGLVWTALVTWPLMSAVQEICDRTALDDRERSRRAHPSSVLSSRHASGWACSSVP